MITILVPPRVSVVVGMVLGASGVFAWGRVLLTGEPLGTGFVVMGSFLLAIGVCAFTGWSEWMADRRVVDRMREQATAIERGDLPVSRFTPVVRYRAIISMLVIRFEFVSRRGPAHMSASGDDAIPGPPPVGVGRVFRAITCVFGWWSFPDGIVHTLRVLRNPRGETVGTLADMIRTDGATTIEDDEQRDGAG